MVKGGGAVGWVTEYPLHITQMGRKLVYRSEPPVFQKKQEDKDEKKEKEEEEMLYFFS